MAKIGGATKKRMFLLLFRFVPNGERPSTRRVEERWPTEKALLTCKARVERSRVAYSAGQRGNG
ncbi:hypothetical protein CXB51_007447 [Gossypium anomalum]|uniref:Uncharacterized protein n=1 Tax=Gossypium anomalum TaxID=47600 RepID=A0A8J6D722_9ROSI|nr:hypothetical protein CXB51_007447 [Gossypium anomalum]